MFLLSQNYCFYTNCIIKTIANYLDLGLCIKHFFLNTCFLLKNKYELMLQQEFNPHTISKLVKFKSNNKIHINNEY